MSLLKRIDEDLKVAMKSSDAVRVSALRMAKAAIKNVQIEKSRELSDEEILSVLSSMGKQRRESIDQFSKAGREDLAGIERQELSITAVIYACPAFIGRRREAYCPGHTGVVRKIRGRHGQGDEGADAEDQRRGRRQMGEYTGERAAGLPPSQA